MNEKPRVLSCSPITRRSALQLLALGLTLSIIAFVFHALLGMSSGRVASAFRGRTHTVRWLDRLQAGVFLGLAIRLLFLERPLRS